MAIPREKKIEIVRDLENRFSRMKSVVFSDFTGLSVAEQRALREELKKAGGEYKVAKKTLLRRAAAAKHLPVKVEEIPGPVGIAFGYEDEAAPAQVLFKFSKAHEALKILGGLLDGLILTREQVLTLAKLPSEEELLGLVLRTINGPISGFVGVLAGIERKFLYALQALADKKV